MIRFITLIIFGSIIFAAPAKSQVGFGMTYGVDLYQHLKNPVDTAYTARSVGSAFINLNIGPKLWIGINNISVSFEAQASYAPFAFDTDEYKGMGALSFPILAQLNFGGLSSFKRNGGLGVSLGVGTTFFITDIYLRADEFELLELDLQQAIFGQFGVGLGTDGVHTYLYGRYGTGDDLIQVYSIGLMIDYNWTTRSKIRSGKW